MYFHPLIIHSKLKFHYTDMQFLRLQFRGSEIIQLEDFRIATVEDIASVHSKSYVIGLEKVILIHAMLT